MSVDLREQRPGAQPVVTTPSSRHAWMDLLRIVSVVGVVTIHAVASVVGSARGSEGWWVAVALDLGFVWAVPVFVMLSGALVLAPRQHADGVGAFYRRRLSRLIPAFVAWQVFYLLVVRGLVSGVEIRPGTVVVPLLEGRPYTHLYFLWLIVGLYAVAPVLVAFLGQGGRRRAVAFAAVVLTATVVTFVTSSTLTAAGHPRPLVLLALTQWIPYVGYFLAGWALRDLRLRGPALWITAAATVAGTAFVIWQYGTAGGGRIIDALLPVSYLGPVVAAVAIGVYVVAHSLLGGVRLRGRSVRLVRELSDSAFGVFLVHFVVLILVRRIPVFAEAESSVVPALGVLAVTTVLSFLVVFALRRVPGLRRVV